MRTLLTISVLSLAIAGCGSSSNTRRATDGSPEAGAGGAYVVTPSGGTETGGGTGESGGTGGYVEPVTGGTGNDVATGGQAGEPVVVTGGGAGEPGTGGTGNVGPCTPITCLTYSVQMTGSNELQACGLIEDGCGNYIDCGGCGWQEECGGSTHFFGGAYTHIVNDDGIPNICQGGCERAPENYCSDNNVLYGCSLRYPDPDMGPDSPFVSCYNIAAGSYFWCCE